MSIDSIGASGGFDPAGMAAKFFKKADANGDGGIDVSELKTMMSNGPGAKDAEAIFAKVDTDGNGSISEAENENHLMQVGKEMQARSGGGGSGKMPPPGGGGAPPSSGSGSTDEIYDPKDTNKDGIVSPQEELAYAAKHPEQDTSQGSSVSDKIKAAVDDLMKDLQAGTKYGSQGSLSIKTEGTQSLFDLSA
jgi:hypothetical protein